MSGRGANGLIYRQVPEPLFSVEEGADAASAVSYRVYDGATPAAECAYRTIWVRGAEDCRFWIDGIRLGEGYGTADVMEAVLQFLQYKCREAGCEAMHLRLDVKNQFYLEMLDRYGFYMIDQEERERANGPACCECVLKYVLPTTADEVFRGYILRSARGKNRTQS